MTEHVVTFSNGVKVINVTPHELTFLDVNDEVVTVPTSGVLVNAKIVNEETVEEGIKFLVPRFVSDEDSLSKINELKSAHPDVLLVGSIIAAQAYPGLIVGMVPAPGFERKPPAEKRMATDSFTRYK